MNVLVLTYVIAAVIIMAILFVMIFNFVDRRCTRIPPTDVESGRVPTTNDPTNNDIRSAPVRNEDDIGATDPSSVRLLNVARSPTTVVEYQSKEALMNDDTLPTYEEAMAMRVVAVAL